MKKLSLFLFLLFVISCQEIDVVEPTINLGVESKVMVINSVVVNGSNLNVTIATTPGSKYLLEVYTFGRKNPVKKLGFTADSQISNKTINFDTLKKGVYDLKLINTSGDEIKKPINYL
jgi:hypothetical protein